MPISPGAPAPPLSTDLTTLSVLAICGSLRRRSHNAALLELAQRVAPGVRLTGTDLTGRLPLFNPDLEEEPAELPEAVRAFRAAADEAHGIVIATPEYAYGPAGVTKNALDWLIGSAGLVGKPTLLMSASPAQTGGLRAHSGLLPTLTMQNTVLVDTLSVSRAATRVDDSGAVVDPDTVEQVRGSMAELTDAMTYARQRRPHAVS